ncbi:MAG: hypothetical protein AAF471_04490 [Myxococcota bacterium]
MKSRAWGVLACVLLAFAPPAWTQESGGSLLGTWSRALPRKALEQVNRYLNGTLTIARTRFAFPAALVLEDVSVQDARGNVLASARSIRARLSLSALVKGRVVVTDLLLQGPQVSLRFANGELDWRRLFQRSRHREGTTGPRESSAPFIRIDSFEVEEGRFFFHNADRHVEVVCEGVHTNGSLRIDGKDVTVRTGPLHSTSGTIHTRRLQFPYQNLSADAVSFADKTLRVREANSHIMGLYARAQGGIDFKTKEYDIDAWLDVPAKTWMIGLRQLPFALPGFRASGTLTGKLRDPLVQARADFGSCRPYGITVQGGWLDARITKREVKVRDGVIQLEGGGTASPNGWVRYADRTVLFNAALQRVRVANIVRGAGARLPLDGFASGTLRVTGVADKTHSLQLAFDGQARHARLLDTVLRQQARLNLRLELMTQRHLRIRNASLRVPGLRLQVGGVLRLGGRSAVHVAGFVHDPRQVFSTLPALVWARDMRFGLDIRHGGGGVRLGKGTVGVKELRLRNIPIDQLNIALTGQDAGAVLRVRGGTLAGGVLAGEVVVRQLHRAAALSGSVRLADASLADFHERVPGIPTMSGHVRADINVTGRLNAPQFAGVLHGEDVMVRGAALGRTHAEIRLQAGHVLIDRLTTSSPAAELVAHGGQVCLQDGRLAGQVHVRVMSLSRLLAARGTPWAGQLQANCVLGGTVAQPRVRATVQVHRLSWHDAPLGSGHCVGGLRPLLLSTPSADASVTGRGPQDVSSWVPAGVHSRASGSLSTTEEGAQDETGRRGGPADPGRSIASPLFQARSLHRRLLTPSALPSTAHKVSKNFVGENRATANAPSQRVLATSPRSGAAPPSSSRKTLGTNPLWGWVSGRLVHGAQTVDVRAAAWLRPKRVNVKVSARGVAVEPWAGTLGFLAPVAGVADADVVVQGPWDLPDVSVRLRVPRLGVKQPTALALQSGAVWRELGGITGSLNLRGGRLHSVLSLDPFLAEDSHSRDTSKSRDAMNRVSTGTGGTSAGTIEKPAKGSKMDSRFRRGEEPLPRSLVPDDKGEQSALDIPADLAGAEGLGKQKGTQSPRAAAHMEVRGTVESGGKYDLTAAGRLARVPLGDLWRVLYGRSIGMTASLDFALSARKQDRWQDPTVDGQLRLLQLRMHPMGLAPLSLRKPILLRVQHNRLNVDPPAEFMWEDRFAAARGWVGRRELDLQVRGALPVQPLEHILPQGVVVAGTVQGQLRAVGPWDAPVFQGHLLPDDEVFFHLRGLADTARWHEGSLALMPAPGRRGCTAIRAGDVVLDVGSGRVGLTGSTRLCLPRLHTAAWDARAEIRDLLIRRRASWLEADADITLRTRGGVNHLEGEARVGSGLLSRRFAWQDSVLTAWEQSAAASGFVPKTFVEKSKPPRGGLGEALSGEEFRHAHPPLGGFTPQGGTLATSSGDSDAAGSGSQSVSSWVPAGVHSRASGSLSTTEKGAQDETGLRATVRAPSQKALAANPRSGAAPPPSSRKVLGANPRSGWLRPLKTRVHVVVPSLPVQADIAVARVRGSLGADLWLKSRGDGFAWEGALDVLEGNVQFPAVDLAIQPTAVPLVRSSGVGVRPKLDLKATAQLPQKSGEQGAPEVVELRLRGSWDRLRFTLESKGRDRDDVLARLLDPTGAFSVGALIAVSSQLAFQPALSEVEQWTWEQSRSRVSVTGATQAGAVGPRVQWQVNERVEVEGSAGFGSSSTALHSLRLRLLLYDHLPGSNTLSLEGAALVPRQRREEAELGQRLRLVYRILER